MHNVNWDDFRYVLAVAEKGSLSAAARALGVNHATVLRRVNSFERDQSVELFEKSPAGYRVRPESVPVLQKLRSIEQSIESAARTIHGLSNNSGTVRVTSTDSLGQLVLHKYVRDLRLSNPQLQITLASTNSRLDLAGIDAEITVRPAKSLPDDLEGVRACSLAFGIYGSPDYLKSNPSSDIADHLWLGASELLMRSPAGAWEKENLRGEPVFRADSFLTLCGAAEVGMGLAMMPVFVGENSRKLMPAEQFNIRLVNDIWVAAHPDLFALDRIQFLISFFVDALRADAALLEGRLDPRNTNSGGT
ncbi:MAG: LysR family transcriptional regulator [Hyphomicrobiales bacterium]